ncbi:MAG: redoxin family protein [Opitutae bacterium]|nr:redoxin family protein [Opitutae bacterium]
MTMRVIPSITPLVLVSFLTAAPSASLKQGPKPIDADAHGVGRWVPDVSFETVEGKKGKLSDFKDKKALVVAFTGASCPISKRFAPTLAEIEKTYGQQNVAFLYVDPIAVKGASEDLRKMANAHGFNGPVILDKDESLTRTLGARTTTDTFVLDAARTIIYRGPVDDQYGIGYQLDAPRRSYLREALDAHLSGKPIKSSALWAPGCELDVSSTGNPKQVWTYHNRISRILEANCVECHREGGVGPFALEHYDEAEENAGMIKKVVSEGIMPPWFASTPPAGQHSPWANDRSLCASDKADLLAWIKNGKPEGNPADAPLPIVRKSEWSIGKPDVIFSLPREVKVKATGQMPYVYVRVKTNFLEDRWIQATEVRPTAPEVVHHVLVFASGKDGVKREQAGALAAYVPGNTFVEFPKGVAKKLHAGATLLFQVHYTPTGKATTDRTRIGFRFAKDPPARTVRTLPVANRRISIPANAPNHIETASRYVPPGIVVRAFMPHMHLRGKAFKYELLTQNGKRETLLEVPRYDFNWQLRYELKEPRTLPAGSRIEVTGTFDNSKDNPANPDPSRIVRWGDQSDEEMLIGYVECEFDTTGSPNENEGGKRDLFTQLDKNQDGFLTKNEFTRPALFPLFDSNKDGRVTRKEGTAGMDKLRKRESETRKDRSALRGLLDLFR